MPIVIGNVIASTSFQSQVTKLPISRCDCVCGQVRRAPLPASILDAALDRRLVALEGLLQLVVLLVEDGQVEPGGVVRAVQLDGADEGLQRVHELLLLVVEDADGAPGVAVGLRVVHAVLVGDEGFPRVAFASESAPVIVPERQGFVLIIELILTFTKIA